MNSEHCTLHQTKHAVSSIRVPSTRDHEAGVCVCVFCLCGIFVISMNKIQEDENHLRILTKDCNRYRKMEAKFQLFICTMYQCTMTLPVDVQCLCQHVKGIISTDRWNIELRYIDRTYALKLILCL